jgi:hypothetical protein
MEMKALNAFAIASVLMVGTARLHAGSVYLDDSLGQLWAGDPATGTYTYVGTSDTAAGFGGFTDIAFAGSTLYGLDSSGNLYTIDASTGQIITNVGSTGIGDGSLVGLTGDAAGNLWAGGAGQVYNLNTANGAASQVGTGGGGYITEGDLDFDGSGNLWLTSSGPSGGALYQINTTTGVGNFIGQLADSDIQQTFADVFGVAYDSDNGVLYGYDVSADQFEINTADPVDSNLGEATFNLVGGGTADPAGILGAAFTPAPEPSTFALIGSALILLVAGIRKSNQTA